MALKRIHVEVIARYSNLKQVFSGIFDRRFQGESPKFLFAVIEYKKRPTLDGCYSLYNIFLNRDSKGRAANLEVNLPRDMVRTIQTKLSTRVVDPQVYDAAFIEVLRMIKSNMGQTHALGVEVEKFLADYHLPAMAHGEFSTFPNELPD